MTHNDSLSMSDFNEESYSIQDEVLMICGLRSCNTKFLCKLYD